MPVEKRFKEINRYTSFALCFATITVLYVQANMVFCQTVTQAIKVNQVGYYPFAPKQAIITGSSSGGTFYITSTNLSDTFFTGTLSVPRTSAYSTTTTRVADFSSLKHTGSFVVLVPRLGHSYVFEIGNDVNRGIGIATLKGYYYQRSSMALEERYAGKWHRSAGHPDSIVIVHPSAATPLRPAGISIASPGGWYDAGDYNKYIVNSGITMSTLLSAYEDFPSFFKGLQTNIPETYNNVPDILDEVIYNLRWMLTMQDPEDGGVYNKCTNASFDAMVMPGVTKAPRYVVQKSTAATLDFAAVTAQAARVLSRFKSSLPGLADSCRKAALKAWEWAGRNPSLAYDQNTMNRNFAPVISTGGYGDRNFKDEWFWAASELFVLTGDQLFLNEVKLHLEDSVHLPGWANVAMLGVYSLLRFNQKLPKAEQALTGLMGKRIVETADRYVDKAALNAFGTVMGQSAHDFNWGGNANAANQGILLVKAFLLTGNKKYMDYAVSNLDYLLGRNATGYCFITGTGSRSPMFPHHRPSSADGITDPVPGLLVGGPNSGMQDKCTYPFTEPETAYTDAECSYASNEIAINWNAPVVYLVNAVEALKLKAGYVPGK